MYHVSRRFTVEMKLKVNLARYFTANFPVDNLKMMSLTPKCILFILKLGLSVDLSKVDLKTALNKTKSKQITVFICL